MRPFPPGLHPACLSAVTAMAVCVLPSGCKPQGATSSSPAVTAKSTFEKTRAIRFDSVAAWVDGIGRAGAGELPGLWKGALAIQDPIVRGQVIAPLAARWMSTDVKGMDENLLVWPRNDPRWALVLPALLEVLPLANERVGKDPALVHLFTMVSGAAARQDPEAAALWARQKLGRAGRDIALEVIVEELALKSPERATEIVDVIDDPVIRFDALHGIGLSLGAANPKQAYAWAQGLPEDHRREATNAVLEGWTAVDPRTALAFTVLKNDPEAAGVVFSKWASTAPGDAALAVGQVSDPKLRALATQAVLANIDRTLPPDVSAAKWVKGLPAGAGRDAVSALLANEFVMQDPAEAWRIAQGIDEAAAGADVRRTVIAAVAIDDPDIARKLVDAAGNLSVAEATALRGMIAAPAAAAP